MDFVEVHGCRLVKGVVVLCVSIMSQFSARAIDPAQTDALLEVVTQQITLLTFDEGDEEVLGRLVVALADPRDGVQERLAATFGEIGEAATGILVRGLREHPIAMARRGCGRSLARIMDPFAVPGLILALVEDGDVRVKSAAASALVAIGPDAVSGLLEVVAGMGDTRVTGHAAWALAHMDAGALPMLCCAIASPIGAVRSAIVTAVGAIVRGSGDRGDRVSDWGGAVDLLLKGLDDVEAMVRLEAVNAIAGIGLGSAVCRVVELLEDEHEEVRRSAAIALGKLGDRRALGALKRSRVGDEASSVRVLAALAIGAIGESSTLP